MRRAPLARARAPLVAALLALRAVAPLAAQASDTARGPWPSRAEWVGGTAIILGAATLDRTIRDFSVEPEHRSPALDRLESVGNTLGRGRYLAPALGVAWIGARIAGKRRAADVVARTAAAYVAGNIIVSALKPGLGRHRPDSIGDPFRFRPFSGEGEWHSLPSAHAIHAFTIAAAISSQSRRPWVPAVAYGAAGVVAWSRLYADQHWLSDVAAAGVMGTLAARGVVRWLRPHRH